MCFKKKPSPVTPATKRALLFGDNYPGTNHELSECINDIDNVNKKLTKDYSGYDIRIFKNSDSNRKNFKETIKSALLAGRPGDFLLIWYSGHGTTIPSDHEVDGVDEALYLHDGPFLDDELFELQQLTPNGMTVVANFDSCFSGGMDKDFMMSLNGIPKSKNRYFHTEGTEGKRVIKRFAKQESRWAINAGCLENQTCSDVPELGDGAFTYYYLLSWKKGLTLKQIMTETQTYLPCPSRGFDQSPELIGNSNIFNIQYPE
jgi:hypothetical protein